MSGWDEFDDAPVATRPNSGVQPVIAVPNYRGAGDARDETRTDIAVQGNERDQTNAVFNQKDKLRADYEGIAPIKEYRTAIQQLAQAIHTSPDAGGDNALIYAYAKIMDPASVVRESEMGMASGTDNVVAGIEARLGKEFGWEKGGALSEVARKRLRNEAINSVKQRVQIYDQQRDRFTELAKRNGFDPYEIIGDHDAKPFVTDFQAYDGQGVKDPAMTGGLPTGTDVTFKGNDDSFDRGAWLQKTHGMDVNTEARLMAGLNANSGKQLSYDQLLQIHENAGAPPPRIDEAKRIIGELASGTVEIGPYDDSGARQEIADRMKALVAEKDTATGAIESGVEGAARGFTMGGLDELGAAADTMFDGGTYDENLQKERMMRDAYREANPVASYAGEFVGAAALPLGVAKSAAELPVIGAKVGAASGFLGSDGDIADRALNSGIGAATGYAGGAVLREAAPYAGKVVSYLGSKARTSAMPTVDAANIARAGAEEGVTVNRAMVAPELSNKLTAAESTIAGGPTVRGGMQKVSGEIEGRVNELGKGTAIDSYVAGEKLQGAVKRADDGMKTETDRLYSAYRKASGDPVVAPEKALQQIDDELAELAKSPKTNAGEISYLNDLKSDISKAGLTVDTMLNLRRSMRGQIRERNLGLTQAETRVQRVLNAANDDIAKTLDPKSNAYGMLQRANKSHGERQVFKRQIYKELIGADRDIPIDPDKAFQKLQQWAKPGADGTRLIATWKKLNADEAADMASTIAETIGRDKGSVFSPALLVSQVEKLSHRARVTIFGPEGNQSIDNLITLSNQVKRVTSAFNHSKSGVAINSSTVKQALLTGLGATGGGVAGGSTGVAVGVALASTVMAKSWLNARMLMSPNITKWTAALGKKPNKAAALAHIARLDNMAKAEPAIANDILGLQERLMSVANDNPMKLAADSETPQSTAKTKTIEALQ